MRYLAAVVGLVSALAVVSLLAFTTAAGTKDGEQGSPFTGSYFAVFDLGPQGMLHGIAQVHAAAEQRGFPLRAGVEKE